MQNTNTLQTKNFLLFGLASSIGGSQGRVLTSRGDVVTLQDPLKIFIMIEEIWSGDPLGSFEISMITNWNSHVKRGDALCPPGGRRGFHQEGASANHHRGDKRKFPFSNPISFTHSVMRGVVGVDKNRLRLTVVVVLVVVPTNKIQAILC